MRTKFYTKKGDKGKTKFGKRTLSKDHEPFEFLGVCDQLNSWLGIMQTSIPKKKKKVVDTVAVVNDIQNMLFICMAEAAGTYFTPGKPDIRINDRHIELLEDIVARIDSCVPTIRHFVVPGGILSAAQFDYARTLARTVERTGVTLNRKKKLAPTLLMFLNRLSSVLFALARYENYDAKRKERAPQY